MSIHSKVLSKQLPMSHKKLLELAGKAGAIVRIDATVLIDREVFDRYLDQFREESTLKSGKRYAR